MTYDYTKYTLRLSRTCKYTFHIIFILCVCSPFCSSVYAQHPLDYLLLLVLPDACQDNATPAEVQSWHSHSICKLGFMV